MVEIDDIIGIEDACKITGLKKSTIYKRTSLGTLPHHKLPGGKALRFSRKMLIELTNKNKRI